MVVFESKDPPASERRRAELGKFLRARRARLSPADFGMPAGSWRRTRGLRREELALLAGNIRRLSSLSSEFADLWARQEVAEFEPRVRTFIQPQAGPLTFTTSELQVPATPAARIVV